MTGPVWTRPADQAPPHLTLPEVVAAAIRVADQEGLEAVSVRRVAGALAVRPMKLYSFFSRKNDLIELMIDDVIGEMLVVDLPGEWREALRAIARRTREVGSAHPWLLTALTQYPPIGPQAMQHVEQSLAAISSLDLDGESARALLQAVDAYVIGSGAVAVAERQSQKRDKLSEEQWADSTQEYFEGLVASGLFPHLSQTGSAAALRQPPDDAFDQGLEWLLAGFAASLLPPSSP